MTYLLILMKYLKQQISTVDFWDELRTFYIVICPTHMSIYGLVPAFSFIDLRQRATLVFTSLFEQIFFWAIPFF